MIIVEVTLRLINESRLVNKSKKYNESSANPMILKFLTLIAQLTLKASQVKWISKTQRKTLKSLTHQRDVGKIRLVKADW